MQPVVRDDANQFDRQTHAYAEFRLFTRFAAESGAVADAIVVLHRADVTGAGDPRTTCRITILTVDGATLAVTASEAHPYAAIDRAVAEIADALRSRRHGQRRPDHAGAKGVA